jgi:PAS domain S-box-containing protein
MSTSRAELAEKKLRESEAIFRTLAENTPNMVFIIDGNAIIRYFNHPLTGIDAETLIGQSIFDFIGLPCHERVKEHVRRVFECGESSSYEACGVGPDGTEAYYASSIGPVLDDTGNVVSAVISTQDITKRRDTELALAESERRFASIAAALPCAIFRCAMDHAWTMSFVGGAIERITGYPPADFVNNAVRSYASLVHPEHTEMVKEAVHDAASRDDAWVIDYRLLHADGKERWVHEEGRATLTHDGQRVLDGFIFDITRPKKLETDRLE